MTPKELAALQAENAALRQALGEKTQILHQRGEPMLCAVIDALSAVTQMAEQGHPQAQRLVGSWQRAVKAAEAAPVGGGLVVARNGQSPPA